MLYVQSRIDIAEVGPFEQPYATASDAKATMKTSDELIQTKAAIVSAPPARRFAHWILPVRIVALYQIGLGIYCFLAADADGIIARLVMAVLSVTFFVLGIGMWLRIFGCVVLSLLLWVANFFFWLKVVWNDLWDPMSVFGVLPILLLTLGWWLRRKEGGLEQDSEWP